MYTPPPFKPDRAASLAFAQARGFGLVCAWDGGKPIASPLPFYLELCRRRHAAGAVSCRPSQSAGKARRRDIVLAAGRDRRGCLCIARLVRLAGPGADLALPGRAPRPARCGHCRTTNWPMQIDTLSAKFENWLLPKKPWTSSKMTAGAAGSDEEGDRGSGDDG